MMMIIASYRNDDDRHHDDDCIVFYDRQSFSTKINFILLMFFFLQKISPENIFAGLMRQAPSSITGKIICIVVEAFWQHKWT